MAKHKRLTKKDKQEPTIKLITQDELQSQLKAERENMMKLWRYSAGVWDPMYGYNLYADNSDSENSTTRDLYIIRANAEELFANHPVYAAMIEQIVGTVVHTGFGFSVDTPNKELNDAIEKHIKRWAGSTACDARDTNNLNKLIEISVRDWLRVGESFGLIVGTKKVENPDDENELASDEYFTKLRLLDANKIRSPGGVDTPTKDNNWIVYGVEKDRYGVRKRIHYETSGGKFKTFQFKDPKGNSLVVQLYSQLFAEQTHGLPVCASIYRLMKDLSTFVKSEVQAAAVGSQINVIGHFKDPAGRSAQLDSFNKSNAPSKVKDTIAGTAAPRTVMSISPGVILPLKDGEDITQFKLERPLANFQSFVDKIISIMCASSGFSYEYLFKTFSDSNYASARLAAIASQATAARYQAQVIDSLLKPLIRAFITELVATQKVDRGDMELIDIFEAVKIITPKAPILDLQKEINAYKAGVDANFITQQEATEKISNSDYDQVFKQRSREKLEEKQLGIETDPQPETTGTNTTPGQVGKPPGENSTRG